MNSLSQEDKEYLQKAATTNRIISWPTLLWAPAFALTLWVGLFAYMHHRLPPGTRMVVCLFDGETYRSPGTSDLWVQTAELGLMLLLLVSVWLLITGHVLRRMQSRLMRVAKSLCPDDGTKHDR